MTTAQLQADLLRYRPFEIRVTQLISRERPQDAFDLLHLGRNKFRNNQRIEITYPDFSLWLWRFDPDLKRNTGDWSVNINSYRFQRKKHLMDIVATLRSVSDTETGTALLSAINRAPKQILIVPYWNFSLYQVPVFRSRGWNATTQAGMAYHRNVPSKSVISFSPNMWGAASAVRGPGTDADVVLMHEMVHALRYSEGVSNTPIGDEADDDEEMTAVIVANVHMAEKGQRALRRDHSGHATLLDPGKFLNDPRNVRLVRQVQNRMPLFFDDLADIDEQTAWWNPFREFAGQ